MQAKAFPLQDAAEPNLLEDQFPEEAVPRIVFDGRISEEICGRTVAFEPAEALARDLHITDTTFRDGQQARPPYAVDQIRRIFQGLAGLDGGSGVIRQSEFFLYTRKDRQAVDACRELGARYPEITGWIRADAGDLRLVREMDLAETGMLTSCSDYHIFYKLRTDRRQALDRYLGVVQETLAAGIRPRCHLEDVTRADIDGFVLPFVQHLARLSEEVPEELKVKVRLCDTLGFGVTFPGAALPRSIPKLVYRVVHDGGLPPERLEWHGHNDFHKVHINAVTCWLYGANAVNASLFGIGERTGNPPLEGALFEYVALKGLPPGLRLRAVTELAEYYERDLGISLPDRYPFVGANFNVTRAGIHAEGLRRDERIYNIFDTAGILGRPPKIAITDKSGVDGVALWVNNFLGLQGRQRLGKTRVHKIARWVQDQYETQGRNTAISDDELAEQVKLHFPEFYARRH